MRSWQHRYLPLFDFLFDTPQHAWKDDTTSVSSVFEDRLWHCPADCCYNEQ